MAKKESKDVACSTDLVVSSRKEIALSWISQFFPSDQTIIDQMQQITMEEQTMFKENKSSPLYGHFTMTGTQELWSNLSSEIKTINPVPSLKGRCDVVFVDIGIGFGKMIAQMFFQYSEIAYALGVELSISRFDQFQKSMTELIEKNAKFFSETKIKEDYVYVKHDNRVLEVFRTSMLDRTFVDHPKLKEADIVVCDVEFGNHNLESFDRSLTEDFVAKVLQKLKTHCRFVHYRPLLYLMEYRRPRISISKIGDHLLYEFDEMKWFDFQNIKKPTKFNVTWGNHDFSLNIKL